MFRRPLLSLFVLLWCGNLSAQEAMTWTSAVEEATKQNQQLKSSSETLLSARYNTKAAYGGFLPQVTADADYTNGGRSSASGFFDDDNNAFYSLSLNARQNLFSGFSDWAGIGIGKAGEVIARADLDTTKASVSFDLKTAFAALIYAQDFVKLADDITHRQKDNLNLVRLRFKSGRENKGSFLLSEARLQQAEFDRLQAGNSIETSQQNLARVLGRNTSENVQITGYPPLSDPPPLDNLDALVAQTPDQRRVSGQTQVASKNVLASRANFLPSLDASAGVGRQGETFFPEDDRWSVALSLSLPLFNGGSDFFNVKSNKARLRAAENNQTSTQNILRTQILEAHKKFIESVEKLKTDKAFLDAAVARAEIARSKYNTGLISFEDWDIIENDLISRQKAYLQSQRERVTAEASWEKVLGKGVF